MWISLLLIGISCLIIWRSSHGFEVASDFLGRRLPPGIKGATLNAVASSMPEFLTTLFFLFYLRDAEGFSGGLGVTSGSALFNLLIIPALAVLLLFARGRGRHVRLNKGVLLREGLVLLLSQLLFINFLFEENLKGWHGGVLVGVYLAYLFLLYSISRSFRGEGSGFQMPVPRNRSSLTAGILTLDITRSLLRGRRITPALAWLLLLVSTAVMTFGTWLLVYGTDRFGHATEIPLIFVAVVLSAAATSVPDTIISIKDAGKGNYDDAVSNALGSNIFDIAFALGLPILLYTVVTGNRMELEEDLLRFTQEVWVFLLLTTVLALAIMLTGTHFNRQKAFLLLTLYTLFILFVGTQVSSLDRMHKAGEPVARFLTRTAEIIGGLFH